MPKRKPLGSGWVVAALAAALALTVGACGSDQADDRPASFTYIVDTILIPNCATGSCHSSYAGLEGLKLDDVDAAYDRLLDPADPLVDPSKPSDQSELVQWIDGKRDIRMPPDNPLPDADIALIKRWIDEAHAEKN